MQDPITGDRALPFPPEVKPVFDPEREPTPMPEAELADRLDFAPPWTRDGALLARLFGCRRSEALRLQLRHIDHEEECLRLSGTETKSGKDQRLYGGDAGWQLVLRLEAQARARGTNWLVTWPGPRWAVRVARKGMIPADDDPTAEWQPLKSLRRSWKRSATLAGIEQPHRFHDTRAAYITGVAKLGSSTITRRLARHASMATTERYIAVADQELARAADRAAKRRGKLKIVR